MEGLKVRIINSIFYARSFFMSVWPCYFVPMRQCYLAMITMLLYPLLAICQTKKEDIYSEFVLYPKRIALQKDLHDRIIGINFSLPLDSNSEYKFETTCLSISQFLLTGPPVEQGFEKLFAGYDSLHPETKRAFLEAVYAVYPEKFVSNIKDILARETDPKLFSLCAVYLYRNNGSSNNSSFLKTKMTHRFPGHDTIPVLVELDKWLSFHHSWSLGHTPDIVQLFRNQRKLHAKVIYSFQRWNRDFAGLALLQMEDGRFARLPNGHPMIFEQLARSGSAIPYFLTNGNTPQGIYSIQGIAVTNNALIGPTPNIQLIMPFESSWQNFFPDHHHFPDDSLELYLQLMPASWRNYRPMMEVWDAGKIGRTEIIAHGTTIDPEYFKEKPFYPLTPTQGCLCAKELWNPSTGHLLTSEQFNLVSAYESAPDAKGYLFVINVDDQQRPLTRPEVEKWVNEYEKRH